MTDHPLRFGGDIIGNVSLSKEKGGGVIRAVCPFERDYIYRVSARMGSEGINLGVMLPEGDRFVLTKRLVGELYKAVFESEGISYHIDRRLPGENAPACRLPFDFDSLISIGDDRPDFDYADQIFSACGGMTAEGSGSRFYVAPWEPGGELGPSSFFCLLRYFEYNGKGYCGLGVNESGEYFSFDNPF